MRRLYRITVPSVPVPAETVSAWSQKQAIDHYRKHHPEADRYVVRAQRITLDEHEAHSSTHGGR